QMCERVEKGMIDMSLRRPSRPIDRSQGSEREHKSRRRPKVDVRRSANREQPATPTTKPAKPVDRTCSLGDSRSTDVRQTRGRPTWELGRICERPWRSRDDAAKTKTWRRYRYHGVRPGLHDLRWGALRRQ